jgi:hypothetical protein
MLIAGATGTVSRSDLGAEPAQTPAMLQRHRVIRIAA